MKRLLADLAVYYLLSEMWVPDKRQKIIKPVVEEKVQINWLFNYNLITQLTSRLRLYINSLVPNHAVYSRLLLEMWKLSKRHGWKQFLLRRKKEQEIYHELLENISEIFEGVSNRPLPSSKNPHFQNETRCTTFSCEKEFYLHENEKWFP